MVGPGDRVGANQPLQRSSGNQSEQQQRCQNEPDDGPASHVRRPRFELGTCRPQSVIADSLARAQRQRGLN